MMIKIRDQTDADLLKTAKNSINPSDIVPEMKNITHNKKGELLLTVSNRQDKAEVLREELSNKLPETKILLLNWTRIIYIKGMDEVVTAEEMKEDIF